MVDQQSIDSQLLGEIGPVHGLDGFARFCERYVVIYDRDTLAESPLVLFPGQRRVAGLLIGGAWPLILKGRQLGVTWLCVAWVVWCILFRRHFLGIVVFHELQYATDFIDRVKWILEHLPAWMQRYIEPSKDNTRRMEFNDPTRRRQVRTIVASRKAARSLTADLLIIDEAAYVKLLKKTIGATHGALRGITRSGQIVCLGTSDGPVGDFKALWDETYGEQGELLNESGAGPSGFTPIFMHWTERPGRDRKWYEETKRVLDRVSPVEMKHENPNTVEEAWEHAAGRIYPLFSRGRNVGTLDIPADAYRCRSIDWGETASAYVVLWIAYVPGPPGLLVHPDCRNTIRELIGYRVDDNGKPMKLDDHTCDALRYAVVTHEMRGMVYVYREVYRKDSLAQGWNPLKEIEEVHRLSGWERSPIGSGRRFRPRRHNDPKQRGELYRLPAVADRSMGKMIALFQEYGVPCVPAARIERQAEKGKVGKDPTLTDVLEGCRQVGTLIDGSTDMDRFYAITHLEEAKRLYAESVRIGRFATTTDEARRRMLAAREILGRARERGAKR